MRDVTQYGAGDLVQRRVLQNRQLGIHEEGLRDHLPSQKTIFHSKKNSKKTNKEPVSKDSFYLEYADQEPAYTTGGFNEKLNSQYNQIDNNKLSDFEESLNYIEEKIVEVTESDRGGDDGPNNVDTVRENPGRGQFRGMNFAGEDYPDNGELFGEEEKDVVDDEDDNLYYSSIGGMMTTLMPN